MNMSYCVMTVTGFPNLQSQRWSLEVHAPRDSHTKCVNAHIQHAIQVFPEGSSIDFI